ncbi:MAG: hypothetical protein COT88_00335 [Candidatus Colwellbacteria bacterium CG10_big_fil_rev_8_21_14_0_10_41_28]|uniref:Type 4a pilus biogenesis protein PilO n=1 Tax=Candidatus Colwellbacteria bacterium CG10_big_fil_rev_8_21_14_0_10_41_28 TaxID=1974539 RepID=A0A2H0VJY2_9BACT|nr:MAG: hypothetical protein COT88_00335 [Candidatus Colwellbacteria bacterium CG10_big_fil_rev_8_21_14_0_10_41_28]
MKASAKRLYGTLISFLLMVFAFYTFSTLVIPAYQNVQDLKAQRSSLTTTVEDQRASVQRVKALLRDYKSIEGLASTLSLLLPSERELASIVNQVQGAAFSNLVSLRSINIKPVSSFTSAAENNSSISQPVSTLRLALELTAGYENFKGYIDALETNARLMDVSSIKITSEKVEPYDYSIEVDTYYQPQL